MRIGYSRFWEDTSAFNLLVTDFNEVNLHPIIHAIKADVDCIGAYLTNLDPCSPLTLGMTLKRAQYLALSNTRKILGMNFPGLILTLCPWL